MKTNQMYPKPVKLAYIINSSGGSKCADKGDGGGFLKKGAYFNSNTQYYPKIRRFIDE